MQYTPNQKPAVIKLDRDAVLLILKALSDYVPRLTQTQPSKLRVLKSFAKALPKSLPYEVRVYAEEWDVLSPALRPQGSNPAAGSRAARMYALYTRLRPHCRFLTAQMLAREAKRAEERRLANLRGVNDHKRDPSAPKIPNRRGR